MPTKERRRQLKERERSRARRLANACNIIHLTKEEKAARWRSKYGLTKADLKMQNAQLKDRIAELENELRVSKAQNDVLRQRLLHEEVARPNNRLIAPAPAPTFRLIAPPNPKPMMTLTSRQHQGLENRNPTAQQFVAALEEAEEEERKDVALLNNNKNNMTTTSASSTLSNVEKIALLLRNNTMAASSSTSNAEASSTNNNSDGGIYAKKRNVKPMEPGARRRGYILFSSELRKKLLEEYPSISSSEVYKILSTEWKRLHFEQKIQYEERAAQNIADERAKAAQIELHKKQHHQVQPVQQQQHPHPHYHPSLTSSGSSSTAAECIKEEAMDDD